MIIHESCRWLELRAEGLTNGDIFDVQKAQMFIVEIYDDSVDDKHPIALIPIPSHHWLSPNRAGSAKLNNV